jgi:trehalose 6-phosphate phosphatase
VALVGDRIARAPHLLVGLDFDGTLADIVPHPADAQMVPEMRDVMAELAASPNATVAVVSGRERFDLLARIDIPGLIYAGNHGLEISGPGFLFVEPKALAARPALHALAEDLTIGLQDIPGAFVEDKGLSIAVHDRLVSAGLLEEVRRRVQAALVPVSHSFRVTTGARVFDIRPRVAWNKGDAVGWIRTRVAKAGALAIFLGDDIPDEDAFAALKDEITIKVGPGETVARYRLHDTKEVRNFLNWLVQGPSFVS